MEVRYCNNPFARPAALAAGFRFSAIGSRDPKRLVQLTYALPLRHFRKGQLRMGKGDLNRHFPSRTLSPSC